MANRRRHDRQNRLLASLSLAKGVVRYRRRASGSPRHLLAPRMAKANLDRSEFV